MRREEIISCLNSISEKGRSAVYAELSKNEVTFDLIKHYAGLEAALDFDDYLYEKEHNLPEDAVYWCRHISPAMYKEVASEILWNKLESIYNRYSKYFDTRDVKVEYAIPADAIAWCRDNCIDELKDLSDNDLWLAMKDVYVRHMIQRKESC